MSCIALDDNIGVTLLLRVCRLRRWDGWQIFLDGGWVVSIKKLLVGSFGFVLCFA